MCMKSHQSIFSLFPVKKIEWYLFFKANTKYNKLYCNTLINPDLFLLFLLAKCDLCHVVKNKQKCYSEIHKTLPSISDSFSTTLTLTDNWNMSNLGSTTRNLTVLPIYLTLAIQFRTSFLTTSWAGGKNVKEKKKEGGHNCSYRSHCQDSHSDIFIRIVYRHTCLYSMSQWSSITILWHIIVKMKEICLYMHTPQNYTAFSWCLESQTHYLVVKIQILFLRVNHKLLFFLWSGLVKIELINNWLF